MEFIKNKNIVVLDIETTGIKANTDKIIELYMLKVYNNEVVDEYYSKFNPKIEIPLFISNLTGIYQWHVNSSPTIDQEIKNIKNFIGDSVVIGHNLKFDLSFLNYDLINHGLKNITNENIDTLKLSRALLRNKVKNHKLSTLSRYFKTTNKNEHNSKADVLTTYEVFNYLGSDERIINKKTISHLNSFLNKVDDQLKVKFSYEDIPNTVGIYCFLQNNKIQYVGKSNNLRNRIGSHLSYARSFKSNKIITNSNNLNFIELDSELVALIAEHRIINFFKPTYNRSGKVPKNIYWVKLKSNKLRLEISKIESTKNTLYKFGPFTSYSKAIYYKQSIEEIFQLIKCKKNNARKEKCDISLLLNSQCACVDNFSLENYLTQKNKEFKKYFENLDIKILEIKKLIKNYSKNLEFENAQKYKLLLSTLEEHQEFSDLFNNILQNNNDIKLKLSNHGIKIQGKQIFVENFNDTSNLFEINNLNEEYSFPHFLSELQIILRYLRKSEPNTIVS